MSATAMKSRIYYAAAAILYGLALFDSPAVHADEYASALANFKAAGAIAEFFDTAYGYALFPDVGAGAFIVGGQGGKGRVYEHGHFIGTSLMGGLSIGFQAGGKIYSEIIFFQDRRALEQFESGGFEFSAGAAATAATAQAGASAATNGVEANASTTVQNATTVGAYEHGMAVFTIAKAGLMFAADIGGQKFTYKPRHYHPVHQADQAAPQT